MTERKSTEIKIRVTPSFKARVQSAADAAGVSLTEWLEQASEGRMTTEANWADENRRLDGTALAGSAIKALSTGSTPPHPAKSWMYEGQAPPERRTESCPHSKPPYAFCSTCDK